MTTPVSWSAPVATRIASPIALRRPGRERLGEQVPVVKVSRRRLDRQARANRDGAALALVMVGVDDEAEHEFGVGERSARGAAQVGAHGPRLDIDVDAKRWRRRSRRAPCRRRLSSLKRFGTNFSSTGERRVSCSTPDLPFDLGELDRVLADDRDELAHCVFVNRDGHSDPPAELAKQRRAGTWPASRSARGSRSCARPCRRRTGDAGRP